MSMKLPLALSTWDDREFEAIERVVRSGMYTMGDEVAKFEADFGAHIGSRHCVMVNSGSSANLLMIASLFFRRSNPLRRGDEVVVPAVSWATTYSPLQQYGLRVKFVDVDLETLNFDLDALAAAITDRTRVVFAVNLLGNPNDFARIRELIGKRDIILLEDNCESLGATFEGKHAGTFGLMGSFSCFFSHHISTMEGGVVATDDEELYQIALCLRAHGWTRNLPKKNLVCSEKSDDFFTESFRIVLPGYNLRPLEFSGAVGQEQIRKFRGFLAKRRCNAQTFVQLFRNHPTFMIQREIGESSWFGFTLIVRPEVGVSRNRVVDHLMRNGVECRPIVVGNFTKNETLAFFDYELFGTMENGEIVDKRGFFIGNHHVDIRREIEQLPKILSTVPS